MVSLFKYSIFSIFLSIVLFSCTYGKDDFKTSEYQLEGVFAKKPNFDSLQVGRLYSDMLNLDGIQFEFSQITFLEGFEDKYEIVFLDPTYTQNRIALKLYKFFPYSHNGIRLNDMQFTCAANNEPGDPLINFFEYNQVFYRRKEGGKCELIINGLRINPTIVLPGRPTYTGMIQLEFPCPKNSQNR